jgi:hypothetical protein
MAWGRRAIGGKYHAVRVFVTNDDTMFTRDDLTRLAAAAQVPTSAFVSHRDGTTTLRSLTMKELAASVHLTGEAFDSKAEARHWITLCADQKNGQIQRLRRQVPYELHAPGGAVIGRYVADFVFEMDGETIVQDVKGARTRAFIRSKKHMQAEWGICVMEIARAGQRATK